MVAAFKETNEEEDKLEDDIVVYTIDNSDDDKDEDTNALDEKVQEVATISKIMLDDTKRRVKFIVLPPCDKFDQLYISSTLFSPPYRLLLNQAQVNAAKTFILSLMRKNQSTTTNIFDLINSAVENIHKLKTSEPQ
uniref:Uncharacterized protein n=1 Tax=Amphimedon queenslandica TaxID=400682 RepID=A0A1X7V746_AMPQE